MEHAVCVCEVHFIYALCAFGAVNMQFLCGSFLCAIYKFSFIHSFIIGSLRPANCEGHIRAAQTLSTQKTRSKNLIYYLHHIRDLILEEEEKREQ